MSKTEHARRPRRFTFWWRMRSRPTPRPELPKRVDIAERIAAMLEDLLDAPAHLAVPECIYEPSDRGYDDPADAAVHVDTYTDTYFDDEPLAPWERELLDGMQLDRGPDEQEEPDAVEDWSRPHPLNFTDAHCRECEGCAYEHAQQWVPEYFEPNEDDADVSEVAYGIDPDYPFPPVLTYGQAVAEMGDGFMVTGPNAVRPEGTSRHYLRVYELARICELPSHAVVALLRLQDEYVANHLSLIARPAASAFLAALDITGDLDALVDATRPLTIQEKFARAVA